MNSLNGIIERCHQRHKNPLRQRKTIVIPALYNKGYPYHFKVYCAHRYSVMLSDLEQAGISFMPIGRAPGNDRGPRSFGDRRFLKRQRAKDWKIRRWFGSWGLKVYTGIPSEREGARWHDIDFNYEAICTAPDAVFACIEALINTTANPLLTMSKSGGLRFSCRVLDYLHPNTVDAQQYIYRHTPTPEYPHQREVYLEIFGEAGYSCWDARYEILLGNLLDPPVLSKEVFFAPLDALRAAIHRPAPSGILQVQTIANPPLSLGSRNLDLAKEAFVKRGFSYVRQEGKYYHWQHPNNTAGNADVSFWESEEDVLVQASTPNIGLPIDATPITNVWNDTGILPPLPAAGLPVSDKVLVVREGELSPLAVKRPSPMLCKPENSNRVYVTRQENIIQIQHAFDQGVRILGYVTDTSTGKDYKAESYVLNGGAVCLSIPPGMEGKAANRFQERSVSSVAHWRSRMYRWEQVKDIPVDERMENPFQRGNLCEDSERCDALEKKGGNPDEVICPQCPVYMECQQRGYLSQLDMLQRAKVQISTIHQMFFDPNCAAVTEEILKQVNNTERLCIIDETHAHKLFLKCELPKSVLEEWSVNWHGSALGNFAKVLLNAVEIKGQLHNNVAKRVRTVMQTFEWQKEEIIRQMCQINVRGRVVEQWMTDPETDKELARFSIEFESGISAYIPLDDNAADKLTEKGLPFFRLRDFVINEDMKIQMSMMEAIELGILDVATVESIHGFPTVCHNPNWTFWHQSKRFLAYYTRDTDAPMRWDDAKLRFRVPPVLHPSVKRLLLISPTLSEQELRKIFPNEVIEVISAESISWSTGNQVFQIRTGNYPQQVILDYDSNWDTIGMSETAQRFFLGIRAEIERDPNVKHAIITYRGIAHQLAFLAEKENVCFVTDFKDTRKFESSFEEAQVIWIVGIPNWASHLIWQRAQILFGNDKNPLRYEKETETHRYKDERIQHIYEKSVVGVLTQIIGRARLHQLTNKKIILMTSFVLPDITDRPETLLFDWEDFEIAGGLDKLPEVIATREQFETERDNLTAESSREKVRQVLGYSDRHTSRVLEKLRGGRILRVPFRDQILSLLASGGETKTAELVAAIDGHPKAVNNELTRLVNVGEIVKVRRGVYALPKTVSPKP